MKILDKVHAYTRPDDLKKAGLYPYFSPFRISNKKQVMLGSNNYLGLTKNSYVIENSLAAVRANGTSCTGSRFLNGTLHEHIVLEKKLAEFYQRQDAQTFTTGYQANLGVLASLAGKDDVIVLDKEVHASVIDGAMMAVARGATIMRFKHNCPKHLSTVLSRIPAHMGKVVVVDGVYSMGGDLADLPALVPICKQHDAMIIVDDAHGSGVLGNHGRGTVDHFGLNKEVDLITGTFSKSFASLGGYVVGKQNIIDFIRHNSRALIFSAAMTPIHIAAAMASLQLMLNEPQRQRRLLDNAKFMRHGLTELGFDIGNPNNITPIIPIFIRDETLTIQFYYALLKHDIYTNPVLPPAVANKDCLLRTSYMSTQSVDDLQIALTAFAEVGESLGILKFTADCC
jgi:8-amino-7-oxononanoate synthase